MSLKIEYEKQPKIGGVSKRKKLTLYVDQSSTEKEYDNVLGILEMILTDMKITGGNDD